MSSSNNVGFEPLNLNDMSTIALSVLIFICLFFSGRAITGPRAIQPIQAFIGLLTVYLFFIINSALFTGFLVIYALIFLLFLTCVGLWKCRKNLLSDSFMLASSIIFIAPLLWLAVVKNNPLWDDYTHWLPSAQYLLKNGHLPTLQEPVINHATPAYPYSRALLHTFVNLGTDKFMMNVQGLFNILFASSLLLWAGPFLTIKNKNLASSLITTLSVMGILSFLLIIWTITLNSRLIISSYGDPIYAISLAHLFLFLFISGDSRKSISNGNFNWILAGLIAVPSIIKDVGLYHSLIIFISYWVIFEISKFFQKDVELKIKIKVLLIQLLHLAPMIFIKNVWAYYIKIHEIKTVFAIKALEQSKINLIPQILEAAEAQLLGRPFVLVAIFIMLSILLFSKPTRDYKPFSFFNLFLFALMSSLGIILFQIAAYLFTFSASEAARAASFSRYIAPAGLIAWTSLITALIIHRILPNYKTIIIVGSLFTVFFFGTLIGNANKINPAKNVDSRLKSIAEKLVKTYPENEPLMIVDLGTNGIHAVIIRFYTNSFMPIAYRASVHLDSPLNTQLLNDWFEDYKHVYLHSGSKKQLNIIKEYLASRELD